MHSFFKGALLVAGWILSSACGGEALPPAGSESVEAACELALGELPFATEVIEFTPGVNGGFGDAEFPDVVLGPPEGGDAENGALNVLSLGVGGEIILGFGDRKIADGDGPDFVVFENPFGIGGDATNPFAELARVSVSVDGENWRSFDCDNQGEYPWPGCAGWRLVETFPGCSSAIDSSETGGDVFDLSVVGLEEARFVRIQDLAESGSSPSAGFDLDAVGVFHFVSGP